MEQLVIDLLSQNIVFIVAAVLIVLIVFRGIAHCATIRKIRR